MKVPLNNWGHFAAISGKLQVTLWEILDAWCWDFTVCMIYVTRKPRRFHISILFIKMCDLYSSLQFLAHENIPACLSHLATYSHQDEPASELPLNSWLLHTFCTHTWQGGRSRRWPLLVRSGNRGGTRTLSLRGALQLGGWLRPLEGRDEKIQRTGLHAGIGCSQSCVWSSAETFTRLTAPQGSR